MNTINMEFDFSAVVASGLLASAYVPDVVTKELAISNRENKRRIVLSTNFLKLMGWEQGVRHDVIPMNQNGLLVKYNPLGNQMVYQRRYNSRKNNPFETQIDIANQSIIDSGIPKYTERLHFEMRRGEIVIRPLKNQTFSIRKSFADRVSSNLAAFVAMTAGVDVRCLKDCGFSIDSVLEYRPQEKRDRTDFTETGAINVLANAKPRLMINEDISKVDMHMVERLMSEGPPIALLHLSLQCDDFTNLKSSKAKNVSIESLDTSMDLLYDGLRLIETVKPAAVLLEQVPGFANSLEGRLFAIKLRKWGYYVTEGLLNGVEQGGRTNRTRYYLVASVWPNFKMPTPVSETNQKSDVWQLVEQYLPGCRDVSHTKSVADGIDTGRIRIVNATSKFCPTITKSQNRQAKDSIYIEHDGKFFLPSVELLSRLQGIPNDFNYSSVGETIASEIIGQSVDYTMHERLALSVYQHIQVNAGDRLIMNIK
ncbi:MAG: DNA methyltransferase [Methylotenera sp.]|nr:MAG: DNA methyltransferase [Methylotenera sp.]